VLWEHVSMRGAGEMNNGQLLLVAGFGAGMMFGTSVLMGCGMLAFGLMVVR
jgi:hypothetical protein